MSIKKAGSVSTLPACAILFPYRARDGNRTRTGISAHRILSPACLPIPPSEPKERNLLAE